MNINPVNIISNFNPKQIVNFKSRYIVNNGSDSFERTGHTGVSSQYGHPKRRRTLASEERKSAKKLEKRVQRQKEIKREFIALNPNELNGLLEETVDIVSDNIYGMQILKKQIMNPANSIEYKRNCARIYKNLAESLRAKISEYEAIERKLEEFYDSGKAKSANIPDLRINLSPENIEYYRELINFDPYSLID